MDFKVSYVKNSSCYQYEILSKSGALLLRTSHFKSMQEAEMQAKIKIRMIESVSVPTRGPS